MSKLLLLLAVVVLGGGAADDGARAVLARTKTTSATYASYGWMTSRDGSGSNEDSWASEFHSGDWHRIENRWRHVLANCRTHDLFEYEVATGELKRGKDADSSACGITLDGGIDSVVRLASVKSNLYGKLDAIRVTDERRVRRYQVDTRGILVRVDWRARDGSQFPCLDQEPIAILPTLPSKNIFTEKSLAKTVTPEAYQTRPSKMSETAPSGKRCGS